MDGDKVYGLCSLCGGALLSDHDRRTHEHHAAVDWHAVARDAAVALWSHPEATNVKKTCDAALELVAEMRKRAEFGGGA